MTYELESGRRVRIPDATIDKYITTLNLSQKEAIKLYLEEEGYEDNPELQELNEKAGKIKTEKAREPKKKAGKPARKENQEKRFIISDLCQAMIEADNSFYGTPTIVNPEREISFTIGENNYSITLICHRSKD